MFGSGALGAVSVVTESVSQSAGVSRPQATQARMRLPRCIVPVKSTVGSMSFVPKTKHGYECSQTVCSRSDGGDTNHSNGQQVVIYSLKIVQHHEWTT